MHRVEVEIAGIDVNVVCSSTQSPLTWCKGLSGSYVLAWEAYIMIDFWSQFDQVRNSRYTP